MLATRGTGSTSSRATGASSWHATGTSLPIRGAPCALFETTLPTRWWSPQRSLEADLNRARGQGFFDREPP
jgi:hypothetical protein